MQNTVPTNDHIVKLVLYFLYRSGTLYDFVAQLSPRDRKIVHELVLDPTVHKLVKTATFAALDHTRK